MYKWITAVGISSAVIFDNKNSIIDLGLLNNLVTDKSTISSMMNVISYDYQWMPNLIDDQNDVHTMDDNYTNDNFDISITNHCQPIGDMCVNFIENNDIDFDQYFSFTNVMSDKQFSSSNTLQEMELGEKILKHKKSSSFGFSALQKRIERVKCDLKNLTNKLNPNNTENHENNQPDFCYYNMALGNMLEEGNCDLINESAKNDNIVPEKTWKCPSQFNSKNPFSELSESTQKILGRLHLKENEVPSEVPQQQPEDDLNDSLEKEDGELEMEEDELEFTFTQKQNSFLNTFISKGTLSVIEEQDEYDSSSDESDSAKSTVIERTIIATDDTLITKSSSIDITDSESYGTPMSSFRVTATNQKPDTSDDTEEYFSDFAKCSVSSYSSRESLKSHEIDKFETSCTETTIKADNDFGPLSEHESCEHDKSSSSLRDEEEFASEAEYDNSGWSTEDIPQSVEQSDSLYDKPYRSMLKSSLPDLLESSDICHDNDNLGGSLIARHYNKSTDLDEILDQISPYHESSVGRLSQSMSNLFPTRSNTAIRPDDFFLERASFDNLLETDLDSGYVSIYKPVMETEIMPKVDFSCSMGNVSHVEGSFNGLQAPLVDRLRKKAGSVTELRIADSLSKLSIPDWLNLPDDDGYDRRDSGESNNLSLPMEHSPTSLDRTLLSSQRRMKSLPRPCTAAPVIKAITRARVVLPSELLRQSCQINRIVPIKFCQARNALLPTRMSLSSLTQPLNG